MSVKILGGFAKGYSLKVSKNRSFRPTLTTLKRKVFDRFQDHSGFSFIDCFAGSGAIGLESLSRGASKAIFFEKSYKNFKLMEGNILSFSQKFQEDHPFSISLSHEDFTRTTYPFDEEKNKVFFIDPPYSDQNLYLKCFKKLENTPGFFWVEGDEEKGISIDKVLSHLKPCQTQEAKIYKQGTHYIICHENVP